MQMITEVGAEQNTTTILMMPTEFVTMAEAIAARSRRGRPSNAALVREHRPPPQYGSTVRAGCGSIDRMDIPATGIPLVDLGVRACSRTHAYLITLRGHDPREPPRRRLVHAGRDRRARRRLRREPLAADAIVAGRGLRRGGHRLVHRQQHQLRRSGGAAGRPLLERYGHRFAMGERRLKDAEGYFERHGSKTILFGRFAPGIKNFASACSRGRRT